jgi:hypothetical protein
MVSGEACAGDTPAAWIRPRTPPIDVASCTRVSTEAREDTSTFAVLTSKPASLSFLAAASAFFAQISQQDVLARSNPPRNRLADRSGPDENDHICHGVLYLPLSAPDTTWSRVRIL